MNKKLVISLSVVLGIVLTMIILLFTVFTVKSVEIDFRTSTEKEWSESEIVEGSKIPFGKCLLFMSTKKFEENLETTYPYLEVINIEKVFPSKIVIHVAEREELFVVQNGESQIYLDKDFKVLKIADGNFESTKENPILLKGLNFDGQASPGEFLKTEQDGLKRFYASMVENRKTLEQTEGFVKEITLEKEDNPLTSKTEVHMTMQTFAGREIKILNINSNLNHKLTRALQIIPMLYETLVDNGDYTSEEVDRMNIAIGNQITNEKELYVHVYLDGEIVTSPSKND